MRYFILLLLAVSLFSAERSGPYLGLGYGIGLLEDDGYYVAEKPESRTLLRAYGGAYLNENFSVELDYTHFNAFEGEHALYGKLEEQFTLLTASAAVHYPVLDDTLDLFAKFGAGEVTWNESGAADRSDSAAALLYGVGCSIRFMEVMSFKIGVDLAQFSLDDANQNYDMLLQYGYGALEVQF